jgi:hypothetical protein
MNPKHSTSTESESQEPEQTASFGESKIVFHPGCFDNFEGTQEELQELIAEIHRLFASGEIFANAVPISDEDAKRLVEARRGTLN